MLRLVTSSLAFTLISATGAEASQLSDLISKAYAHNPALAAMEQKVTAIDAAATARATPADPMVGISELNRGASTRYWSVGQKLELPWKYSLRSDIEKTRSQAHSQALAQRKLDIRADVATTYYAIYAVQRIRSLTKDDLAKIKEFSRIAETKYAAGTAPLQDSMKAHFAQTKIETDLIELRQEEDALQARMRALIDADPGFIVNTRGKELSTPSLSEGHAQPSERRSPRIKQKKLEVAQADLAHSLAKWEYAPDFQFKYQGRLSGDPEDTHIVSLEMSLPLWFWGRSASERSSSLLHQSKTYELEAVKADTSAAIDTLRSKVKNQGELLSIFKTSLIPQAITSYESSVDAYKANRVNFLSLLDSERSLLKVRIAFHRTLTQYVESLTRLEANLGYIVSDLADHGGKS